MFGEKRVSSHVITSSARSHSGRARPTFPSARPEASRDRARGAAVVASTESVSLAPAEAQRRHGEAPSASGALSASGRRGGVRAPAVRFAAGLHDQRGGSSRQGSGCGGAEIVRGETTTEAQPPLQYNHFFSSLLFSASKRLISAALRSSSIASGSRRPRCRRRPPLPSLKGAPAADGRLFPDPSPAPLAFPPLLHSLLFPTS